MLINSLIGSSGVQQQNIKKTDAKLLAAISSLVSGNKTRDVADFAISSQLQSQVVGLKQVSGSLAQANSLTQVADGAIDQSGKIVDRLKEIALQAGNGAINADQRKLLDKEFQALVKELDSQVANTQFNGKNLLDGSVSGGNKLSLSNLLATDNDGDNELSIDSLASDALFKGKSLDVLSADGAADAIEALNAARTIIATARANVGAFQQTLNYASASIDSAIVNQEAARSLLSDSDFFDSATQSQQSQVQRNAQLSLAAQTNRLPAALLQLVS